MKNRLLSLILLLSILAFFTSSAFTSPLKLHIQLLSTEFLLDKGITFKFYIWGEIHPRDIKGVIVINKKNVKLRCNYKEKETSEAYVTCTAAGGTAAKYAGESGIVTLAGQGFWFRVPARP